MNQSRHPFRINVGFLFNQPIGYIREIPFDFPQSIALGEFHFEELSGIAAFHRTQNGLRLIGDFKAETKTTCVRCLEEFSLSLDTQFEEIYTYPNHPLSENEALIPDDGFLDLEQLIGDYLMVEVPINPICREDCRGLCNECGQNLNLGICSHHQQLEPNKRKLSSAV